jgi:hypothetical protein
MINIQHFHTDAQVDVQFAAIPCPVCYNTLSSSLLYPVQIAAIPCPVHCYTPSSSLLYPGSSLLYQAQFAAIPRTIRCFTPWFEDLALSLRGASPTDATCPLPPRGWGCRTVNGFSTPNHPPPRLRLDGRLCRGGSRQQHTTLPAPAGRPQPLALQLPQPVLSPREDIFRLFELCVANGFTGRVAIRSAAGTQEITLSCHLRAPSTITTAPVARCRRHQNTPHATRRTL